MCFVYVLDGLARTTFDRVRPHREHERRRRRLLGLEVKDAPRKTMLVFLPRRLRIHRATSALATSQHQVAKQH